MRSLASAPFARYGSLLSVTARRAGGALSASLGGYVAFSSLYLLILTGAALRGRHPRSGIQAQPATRFHVIIPAHNEELSLPATLSSIRRADYPAGAVKVHVVADNCSDETARVAAGWGANVYERRNGSQVGKGYALSFGLEKVLEQPDSPQDAILILDADTVIASNTLKILDQYLQEGAQAIQTHYSVHNRGDAPAVELRYLALSLYHYARPLGRTILGLSAGLRGNGMCFTRAAIARVGWIAHGLAEDVEQHFLLLEHGIRVQFAPEAVVMAEMPVSLPGSVSQHHRWERGRLDALRHKAPHLLALSWQRCDVAILEAVIEQCVAPLSVCFGAAVTACALGVAGRNRIGVRLGLSGIAGYALYVVLGLRVARVPLQTTLTLRHAPKYVVWKIVNWVRAAMQPPPRWQRTTRLAECERSARDPTDIPALSYHETGLATKGTLR
ncbi:MAG: glycosyltransferase family 2 protein [Chloroflexi bacterium]|nr:glycosyltransferase family 2 protein [Chloroflexota bacterium]